MEERELNKTNGGGTTIPVEYHPDGELTEAETEELVKKVDEKAASTRAVRSFIKHLKALGNYLFDPDVTWYRKTAVVAALIYFITPIDSIPDFTPFAGFLDDLGVITMVVRFLGKEIETYY